MFALSPYQSHTVRSMNPVPPPSLGLLPINSISSPCCQSLEENITSVIGNAHKCNLGVFPLNLRVDMVIYMLSFMTLLSLRCLLRAQFTTEGKICAFLQWLQNLLKAPQLFKHVMERSQPYKMSRAGGKHHSHWILAKIAFFPSQFLD